MNAHPYIIKVSGAPGPCYYVQPGDEDDVAQLITTSDIAMASRWTSFSAVRTEVRRLVNLYPSRQFLVNVDHTDKGGAA